MKSDWKMRYERRRPNGDVEKVCMTIEEVRSLKEALREAGKKLEKMRLSLPQAGDTRTRLEVIPLGPPDVRFAPESARCAAVNGHACLAVLAAAWQPATIFGLLVATLLVGLVLATLIMAGLAAVRWLGSEERCEEFYRRIQHDERREGRGE